MIDSIIIYQPTPNEWDGTTKIRDETMTATKFTGGTNKRLYEYSLFYSLYITNKFFTW